MSATRTTAKGKKLEKPPKPAPLGGKGQAEGKKGRPAKFTEPEVMAAAIEAYFSGLEGDDDKPNKPPTMAGLARFLGFADRQSLRDYAKRDGFSCVNKGIFRVEEWWETRLASNAPTGSIFWLKNHASYSDKTEVEHSGSVTIIDDIPKAGQ